MLDASVSPTAEVDVTATLESISAPESVSTTTVPIADPTAYVLKQGDKNQDVKALQKILISLGWLSGTADGDHGPKTVSAVKAYQDAASLPVGDIILSAKLIKDFRRGMGGI